MKNILWFGIWKIQNVMRIFPRWNICPCVLSCLTMSSFYDPIDCSHRSPLSMGFSRQECWVGCHFLLQGIFLTQRSNLCLLHFLYWRVDSLPLCHLGILWVHWKTKQILCDSLYCDIHFIAVVWNRTHSISEVCLYIKATLLARKCLAGWTGHKSFL